MNAITDPIREHIATADAHQLKRIRQHVIPNTKGLSDEELAGLYQCVNDRYAALNAEAGYGGTNFKSPLIVKNVAADLQAADGRDLKDRGYEGRDLKARGYEQKETA
jgi:hypothetical protein